MKSNIWICKENPDLSGHYLEEKLKGEIPGDHKLEFIKLENPMMNPNNIDLINREMNSRQKTEYNAYRHFLIHGNDELISS